MTEIQILFGTESGNAELVADDIAETFTNAGIDARVVPMEDVDVASLADLGTVVVVTSTYGEGELPATTAPFAEALVGAKPDLSGLRFAAFGLGDSSYETYSNAVDILTEHFAGLRARQIGETGRHDAVSGDSFTDVATSWAKTIVDLL
ncbi:MULTISPECIES: flavodoxin domain-containing protein [Mycobacteriaceae]|uniref:flavodoxin domain-containing protein n=1 Tax=Mycobacteriaceae TaxID=1762 RepID=UPI0007E9FF3F|nr:flavodoxin domain-containing protein [Mycobacterium sp. 852013-50091_SCH5140682]OBC15387.1 nitric oxide synthase [Mycobacterium sp. 852013-50091_SCH5140682]